MSTFKHTPGPWHMSGPMGTDHLKGREPWFWVSADRTLHLQVKACSDGYVRGENEANARLIAEAPNLAFQLLAAANYIDVLGGDSKGYRAALAKATRSEA